MSGFPEFRSIAVSGEPEGIFAALDDLVQRHIGAIITSCTTIDLIAMKAERVYTNQPDAYPLSGQKDIEPNRWTRLVLEQGRTFVANTVDEIIEVFPDHEVIRSLGCGSAMNVPVILSGKLLGTLNLLHEPGHFTPQRVETAGKLYMPAALAFCSLGNA